ncbi:amino acid ABC transporter membrane protein 1 (PAAT family) [Tamaricihabitans halophyticus]|uniref:Amino acid ABC transporter membrane protein 1 (PAAT family) n=1 Tax=Tamaricihabitans halophyticus TaxID=1262583 RepID=A0A4R2QY84_9PSEU|nr:amino acid ABC transporter permease [Tamaricihabitans halophyticus]TCP55170.1 amino acid ABC transporter membrane protein 1 (PAAT family) [Tamaricihabitans halophyticus]
MDVLFDNLDVFANGFYTTIQLFVVSGIGSLILGTALAMLRVSPVPVFRSAGTLYVTIVRNTPLTLVFLFFAFAYPRLDMVDLSFFMTACVALTVYTSAFICEVVRSGINTVPVGQAEAARALGLGFGQVLGTIVLPQAFRSVLPPMMSMLIALLKNTTIAAGFSVAEAGQIRSILSERGENQLLTLIFVAVGFILLVMILTSVQRTLEKRWSVAR